MGRIAASLMARPPWNKGQWALHQFGAFGLQAWDWNSESAAMRR
jgi:hypothetical protein